MTTDMEGYAIAVAMVTVMSGYALSFGVKFTKDFCFMGNLHHNVATDVIGS